VTTDPSAGARSIEVELKFDVDDEAVAPDWSGVPGVVSVSAPDRRDLDAAYFDTADAALARAGYALRRRTGGPDQGWHIKGPRIGDARVELHWPLDEEGVVPDGARAALADVTTAPLHPLARIRNTRVAYELRDAAGAVVAEFADDHVSTRDERSGVQRTWREWEVELGPGADGLDRAALFAAVTRAVQAAGGRAAASDSKLARALGA
jgi:inorganic triphosphatase YgiF